MKTIAAALLFAATTTTAPSIARASPSEAQTHRWGVELDLVQPFIPEVHIIAVRATRTLWGESGSWRGDVMFGAFIRPAVTHDIVETINEYLVSVGYRQYLGLGFHAEAAVLAGWAHGKKNRIDGKDYSNPSILLDVLVGYRFGFMEPGGFLYDGTNAIGFYLTPQFGFITGVQTDIGPRGGKSDFFLQGKLVAGVSF